MPTTRALPSIDCSVLNASYAYKFEFLPHSQLLLDGVDETAGRILEDQALKHYQRAQQKVTARIVKNGFDPLLFQPLIVNEREDGTYAIGDGGGRYMAIQHYIDRNLLPYDVALPCLVCAISPEDEPLWFVKLNREKLKTSRSRHLSGRGGRRRGRCSRHSRYRCRPTSTHQE